MIGRMNHGGNWKSLRFYFLFGKGLHFELLFLQV